MPDFALYYIPPAEHPLYPVASELIGYDLRAEKEMPVENPSRAKIPGFDVSWVDDPHQYGLHMTIAHAMYFQADRLAAIEAEIATLPAEDRESFLADLGLAETGLSRIIRAGYDLLGLITFFTAGPKESRAWTVHRGAKAPEAAGEIHTDFERGFIRAETIAFDDYVATGGEAGAKEAGKMRAEGKEYVVQDGDVLLFRFNV